MNPESQFEPKRKEKLRTDKLVDATGLDFALIPGKWKREAAR